MQGVVLGASPLSADLVRPQPPDKPGPSSSWLESGHTRRASLISLRPWLREACLAAGAGARRPPGRRQMTASSPGAPAAAMDMSQAVGATRRFQERFRVARVTMPAAMVSMPPCGHGSRSRRG